MGQIRDTQIVQIPPVVFAPDDDPPRDLIDFEWGTGVDERGRPVVEPFTEDSEEWEDVVTEPVDDDVATGKVTKPKTTKKSDGSKKAPSKAPKNLRVVKQTVRFDSTGKQVVDVVIGWDALTGVKGYEVRLSKA